MEKTGAGLTMPDQASTGSGNTDAVAHAETEARAELALLYIAYSHQRRGMLFAFVGVLVSQVFALDPTFRYVHFCTLYTLCTIVVFLYLERKFRLEQPGIDRLRHWQRTFAVECFFGGLSWTAIPVFNILHVSPVSSMFLAATIMGISAAGLSAASAQRVAMQCFITAILLPPSLIMLFSGERDYVYGSIAILACLVTLTVLGSDMHRRMREQLKVQFALEQALEQAESAKLRAEAANAARGQFLATMSHELRTPMNGVLGMLQLVQGTALDARQQEYLGKMDSAARSLLALLNDVLDFSKLDSGRLTVHNQPFSVNRLMHGLSDIMAGNVRHAAVSVHFEMDARTPAHLVGDDQLLHQVLVNLAGNALKFTEAGQVVVSLQVLDQRTTGVRLRFAVKDTGIGIAEEHQGTIFDAFVQAEASTTRRFGGTGLGLAICKQLVQLMGGTLHVQSAPGQGSTFWFDLDFGVPDANARPTVETREATPTTYSGVTPCPDPATPSGPAHASGERLAGIRILLAEDNTLNQQVATELLALEGAQVQAVGNGEEAVQALLATGSDRPDIVLMDMHMPVMDGLSATRTIRQQPALAHLPILAMTANAMSADRQACLDAGMNGYVGKPFTIDTLVQTILRHLARHHHDPAHAPVETVP